MQRTFSPRVDHEPPSLKEPLDRLQETVSGFDEWIVADEDSMSGEGRAFGLGEDPDQSLLRVILHIWFHAGEVNAMRQSLGYPEVISCRTRTTCLEVDSLESKWAWLRSPKDEATAGASSDCDG